MSNVIAQIGIILVIRTEDDSPLIHDRVFTPCLQIYNHIITARHTTQEPRFIPS